MANTGDLLDDGLGPDPLDRSGQKEMAGGSSSGGSYYDPSYEDALRIMGRAFEIPSPFEQRARVMDNPGAAELARRLSMLRHTAGGGDGMLAGEPTPRLAGGSSDTGQAVEAFIAALQEDPADGAKLSALCLQIEESGAAAKEILVLVCEHPEVQPKLAK